MISIVLILTFLTGCGSTAYSPTSGNNCYSPSYTSALDQKVANAIQYASHFHKVDVFLVRALIRVESGWPAIKARKAIYAKSSMGAQGLSQLMPITANEMGVTDPFDPAQNVLGGVGYLKKQWKYFGRVDHALMAYVWGPGNLRRALAGQKNIPPSVRKYARKVLGFYQKFKREKPILTSYHHKSFHQNHFYKL